MSSVSPPPPKHVAIIMDGNGRWARMHHRPLIIGHKEGAEAARRATQFALSNNIEYLTLYTFSAENWQRDPSWIDDFLSLLRYYLRHEVESLKKHQIRLRIIGDRTRFPDDLQELMTWAETETSSQDKLCVCLALGYSGRNEIIRAIQHILGHPQEAMSFIEGKDPLDELHFSDFLDTKGIPDPDILIRTGGEKRVSNFLLWQLAYTEFVFLDCLWPDFHEHHFHQALTDYHNRSRRYGRDTTCAIS